MRNRKTLLSHQAIPLALTFVVCGLLILAIYAEVVVSNIFTRIDILRKIHFSDILIGMTIYLKTSVDFAIFIGNLMTRYHTWKYRIAIEIGTAVGNALGTAVVLFIWNIFREVEIVLAIMIVIASFVLLKLAEEGLEHIKEYSTTLPNWLNQSSRTFEHLLKNFNKLGQPVLKFVIPNLSLKPKKGLTFIGLLGFSFTVPFILGLDDFAGYVPLFNIVNVLGFSIGVLVGHMILNILLFISPVKTVKIVKNPYIAFGGSVVFVGLALLGFYEVWKMIFMH